MSTSKLTRFGLAALGALAFLAPAAQANDTFAKMECVLVPGSVAGTISLPSLDADQFSDNWLIDTESGSFAFQGSVTCEGRDRATSNSSGSPSAFAGVYDITASGAFVNLTCGTFTMNGAARLSGPGTSIDMSFGITFEQGDGEMSVLAESGVLRDAFNQSNSISGGNGDGKMNFLPTAGSCTTGFGVTGFLLNGQFETSLSG